MSDKSTKNGQQNNLLQAAEKENQGKPGTTNKSMKNNTQGVVIDTKKKNLIVTVNKEVIRESRKMEQENLEKKDVEASSAVQEIKDIVENTTVVSEHNDTDKSGVAQISPDNEDVLKEPAIQEAQATPSDTEKKKDKRPSTIELKDKSDMFKSIIDIALAYEKLEKERKKLKAKIKKQADEIKELKEERDSLKENLMVAELLCQKKEADIERLQADVEHRTEVIDIVKADKDESSLEFKNAIVAALRTYIQDFRELQKEDMCEDVGYAMIDTLEGVFKVLEKNGINIY